MRSSQQLITYYLQPINNPAIESTKQNPAIENTKQNFLVVECISASKKAKPHCQVFSSTTFSLSQLEVLAVNLEKWDNYYLGLDVGVFVGLIFKKIRRWAWKNPVGRVVALLALIGEVNDFIIQGKQGVAYAVINKIDQKQIELKELEQSPLSLVIKEPLQKAKTKNSERLLPNKRWVFLKGFTKPFIQRLLAILNN
ncbi:MAG: hypothetical protein HAW63_01350 [Bdellovibrionaceae bacterium]|nr:hypothetical protein [Pseudobdellovibrionaceae bacterium]